MENKINLMPRISEKTYGLSQNKVYVVNVDKSVNKITIKKAIEAQFEVKVIAVNLTNIVGKTKKSSSKKGRRLANGKDNDVRKAYVTLNKKDTLPFFDAIEEEEEKEKKVQEEFEKQQEKEASKPTKKISRRKKKVQEDHQ